MKVRQVSTLILLEMPVHALSLDNGTYTIIPTTVVEASPNNNNMWKYVYCLTLWSILSFGITNIISKSLMCRTICQCHQDHINIDCITLLKTAPKNIAIITFSFASLFYDELTHAQNKILQWKFEYLTSSKYSLAIVKDNLFLSYISLLIIPLASLYFCFLKFLLRRPVA